MTVQEAIREFKLRLAIPDYKKQIPEYYQAMDIAVQSLEKQIPKKPLPVITHYNEFICAICPSCQKIAVEVDDNYCRCCGQKLDWGGEE